MSPSDGAPDRGVAAWLEYFQDIGLGSFYTDRPTPSPYGTAHTAPSELTSQPAGAYLAGSDRPAAIRPATAAGFRASPPPATLRLASEEPSLFETAEHIAGDTLERIREDIGDCTRCRLCEQRNKIVFGDGSAAAQLVFVGEGPGRDEDAQGLPFVGRAGQLLTQMIEAMGLERNQVYIANVVKCRPPENRTPERDEVATCSPFLFRQLEVIRPKVIVCLGNVAAQALLGTNRSLSNYRGQWLRFRDAKLLATYHPAYLLRNPGAKGEVWADLKKVMAELGLPARPSLPKR